jgi:hypothetical protein
MTCAAGRGVGLQREERRGSTALAYKAHESIVDEVVKVLLGRICARRIDQQRADRCGLGPRKRIQILHEHRAIGFELERREIGAEDVFEFSLCGRFACEGLPCSCVVGREEGLKQGDEELELGCAKVRSRCNDIADGRIANLED